MAFRREILTTAGLFDEKFRWYRTADIEYSFRVKDQGLRAVVVPVPVEQHEHRMWFQTPPEERASGRSGTTTGSSIAGETATTSRCQGKPLRKRASSRP